MSSIRFSIVQHQRLLFVSAILLMLSVAAIFFAVETKFGFPHFDTYQYSASVGPQSHGLRPILPGVGDLNEFRYGGELSLPGVYWAKRILFSIYPYSLVADQALSLFWLIAAGGLSAILLTRRGWSKLVAFFIFGTMITDPTFLVNVSGTRPEPYAAVLLVLGVFLMHYQSLLTACFAGFLLGLAGTSHVYAALLAPLIGTSGLLAFHGESGSSIKKYSIPLSCGILLGWVTVFVFWILHPDAWNLFVTNLSVQRSFHDSRDRFFSYLASFRLGAGWLVLLLLIGIPINSWCAWWRNGRRVKLAIIALLASSLCLMIPAAYLVLKTDQYFYGVLIWPAFVAALLVARIERRFLRNIFVVVIAAIFCSNMARQGSRVLLGYRMRSMPSTHQQRLDWLVARVAGAPRLYFFTREWDVGFTAGVPDARFYTFPLPMTSEIVNQFEQRTFHDIPSGAMMLFDREYAENCPFHNKGSFDPRLGNEWELIENKIWHYDLSPNKPAARVWELWRKKP